MPDVKLLVRRSYRVEVPHKAGHGGAEVVDQSSQTLTCNPPTASVDCLLELEPPVACHIDTPAQLVPDQGIMICYISTEGEMVNHVYGVCIC